MRRGEGAGENKSLRYIGTAGKYKQAAGDHYALKWIRRQSLIEKKDGAADGCDGCDCTDAPPVPIRRHLRHMAVNWVSPLCLFCSAFVFRLYKMMLSRKSKVLFCYSAERKKLFFFFF